MELTIRNNANTYPKRLQSLVQTGLAALLVLYGLLGQNGAGMSRLIGLICALKEPGEGQRMSGDIDVVQEVAQLLHFLLDTMF